MGSPADSIDAHYFAPPRGCKKGPRCRSTIGMGFAHCRRRHLRDEFAVSRKAELGTFAPDCMAGHAGQWGFTAAEQPLPLFRSTSRALVWIFRDVTMDRQTA